MMDSKESTTPHRMLGGALIGAGMLTVLAMLHHPVINADTAQGAIDEIVREAPLNRLIHGAAIALILIQLYGFMVFRHLVEPGRAAPHLSVLLFAAGAAAMVGAALISGFVTPALAFGFSNGGDAEQFRQLARLAFSGNQALAGFGALALGGAGLVSAWPLWRRRGLVLRTTGALGALLGAMAVLTWVSQGGIDVLAMTVIALALCLWCAAMGVYLIGWRPAAR